LSDTAQTTRAQVAYQCRRQVGRVVGAPCVGAVADDEKG